MRPGGRRTVLYSGAASAAGLLLFLGFAYKPPPDIGTRLSAADFLMRAGRFQDAREHTSSVLQENPDEIQALLIDAYCADRLGKDEESLADYASLLDRVSDPDQAAEIRIAAALLQMRGGRIEEGLSVLRRSTPAAPALQAKVLLAEGMLREGQGFSSLAAELYRRAGEAGGKDPGILRECSARAESQGFCERALEGYRAAGELGDLEAKFLFSRLKFFSGDSDSALAVLREIATQGPRFLERRLSVDEGFENAVRSMEAFPGALPGLKHPAAPRIGKGRIARN